jgi:Protein of unknown function (DUF2868)
MALHCAVLVSPSSTSFFDETSARRVLMAQAFDIAQPTPSSWSAEDRNWATRVARESLGAGATPAQALAERTRHVLHRLLPRESAAQRALALRTWRGPWVIAAALLGFLCGVALDAIGSSQRINLLAPPVWGVILWNLLVYALLLLPLGRSAQGLRGWIVRRGLGVPAAASGAKGPLQHYASLWAVHGTPLGLARTALVMHVASAGLALGLIAGLYTRGLVLDFRVGWESTFLNADTVATLLQNLLAPATWLTGIAVPGATALEALRTTPAPAAPWIHLFAAMLLLCVVLPRSALALWAAVQSWRLSRRISLPLHEPYFARLLRDMRGSSSVVQVLPHGAAPSPQSTLALREWLTAGLGAGTQLHMAPHTPYGQEDQAAALAAPAGTTLRVALVDLSATPEADTHGRWLQALRAAAPSLPILLLADETAFRARFGHLPERLAERYAAWQRLAQSHAVAWLAEELLTPDLSGAEVALQTALHTSLNPA